MKKLVAITLALVLVLSICTVAFAKKEQHFNFGWEKPSFDIHHQVPQQPQKPVTPTDVTDKENQGRPENPGQRPEGGTCTPGDPNCPDYQPTVTDTDVTIDNIFDVIAKLKDFVGKHIRLPKNNDKFYIVGMIINQDGTIEFIYVEKGKEDKGEQRLPAQKDDVTNTDVTATDVPEDMEFIEMGDTNVDGKVSAKDALDILKHAVRKAEMTHEGQKFLADMNEDGVIDARDALKVLRKAVGKE